MASRKETEKEYAKLLFIKEGLSQKEIAERVKVTEKTISKWVNEGNWCGLKRSMMSTRTQIITGLQNQMERWQIAIEQREGGLASTKEADVLIKLASGIKKLENELGVGDTVTVCIELINFVRTIDFEASKKLTDYADAFIQSKMKANG